MLKAALHYATLNWFVLPLFWIDKDKNCACGNSTCDSPGKHPLFDLVPHGLKDATKNQKTITLWWTKYPKANIGIRTGKCSGLFVLDIDAKHDGLETMGMIEKEHGDLTPNDYPFRVLTGGGGYHFYYRYPNTKGEISGRTGILEGFDVRADGNYVVAPPSNHRLGTYNWEI